jgi:hypothetical protein
MSHVTNAKRTVANDSTNSNALRSVAKMNWNTNQPNPFNLDIEEINEYKTIIANTVCNGKCCK